MAAYPPRITISTTRSTERCTAALPYRKTIVCYWLSCLAGRSATTTAPFWKTTSYYRPLNYLRAGRTLMASDKTVFTVSLYNDNAYPWCVSDKSFFRRVNQFSGLGFLMSGALYRSHVLPAWTDKLAWDNMLQVRISCFQLGR